MPPPKKAFYSAVALCLFAIATSVFFFRSNEEIDPVDFSDESSSAPRLLNREESIANRLIVRLHLGVSLREARQTLATHDAYLIKQMGFSGIYLCGFDSIEATALPAMKHRLARQEHIFKYVETDNLSRETALPNDSFFNRQWDKHNTGQDNQGQPGDEGVPGEDLDLLEAWDTIRFAPDIIVGLLDSGVHYTHQDLESNMWRNPGESGLDKDGNDKASNGIDDDENGFVDDVYGANFVDDHGAPRDAWGHGTRLAGILGARGDNRRGITGVAWRTQIMALKTGNSGSNSASAVLIAIAYAIENGADILNCSWGSVNYRQSLFDAIEAAREHGIIFTCSAGNDGINSDEIRHYPAGYELDNIVSVSAFERTGEIWAPSNIGELTCDIAAPGRYILSTALKKDENGEAEIDVDNFYGTGSGTSMATPQVAGILALISQQYPEESYRDHINRLLLGATRNDEFVGKVRSGGKASLAGALNVQELGDLPLITATGGNRSISIGDTVELTIELENESGGQFSWSKDGITLPQQNSKSLVFEVMEAEDLGSYRVTATNRFGSVTSTTLVSLLLDPSSNVVYVGFPEKSSKP